MSFPQPSIPTFAPPPYQPAPPSDSQLYSNEEKSSKNEKDSFSSSPNHHIQDQASTSRSQELLYSSSSPNLNRERFNSPLATNPNWSPCPNDLNLKSLPIPDIGMRIKQRFARSPGNPFQPETPSFQRSVPTRGSNQLSNFGPFDSFALPGKGNSFGDGFEPYFPGLVFVDHDVSSADWERFLEDIEVSGRLSGKERLIAGVSTAPLGLIGAPVGAFFASRAIERKMRSAKEPAVINTVETWSTKFFLARGLDVFLVEKGERSSSTAPEQALPSGFDPQNVRDLENRGLPLRISVQNQLNSSNLQSSNEANASQISLSSTSSSSSSSSNSSVEISKHEKASLSKSQLKELRKERKALKKKARKERKEARKERKRERKDARKERKEDRKDRKRDRKDERKGKKKDGIVEFYLVVQPAAARGITPQLSVQDPFSNFESLQ